MGRIFRPPYIEIIAKSNKIYISALWFEGRLNKNPVDIRILDSVGNELASETYTPGNNRMEKVTIEKSKYNDFLNEGETATIELSGNSIYIRGGGEPPEYFNGQHFKVDNQYSQISWNHNSGDTYEDDYYIEVKKFTEENFCNFRGPLMNV